MLKKRRNRGITLSTLVITIIVILILAGVTIATLTGDNGVITKAIEAKNKNESASIEEKIKLELMASKINEDGGLNDVQLENAIEQLEQNLTIDSYEKGDSEALIKFVLKKGDYAYEIDRNGNMVTSGADRNQRFADSAQTAYKGLSMIKNFLNRNLDLLGRFSEAEILASPSLVMEIENGLNEIYNIEKNTKVYNQNILDGSYSDELILNNKKLTLDLTGIEIEQIKLEEGNYSEVLNKLEALLLKIDDKLSEVEEINTKLNSKKIYGNNKILTNKEEIEKIDSILNKAFEINDISNRLHDACVMVALYANDPKESYIQELKKIIKQVDDIVKSITEDGQMLFDGNYRIKYNLNNRNVELKFDNLTVKGLKLDNINYENLEPIDVMDKINNAINMCSQQTSKLSVLESSIFYYLN